MAFGIGDLFGIIAGSTWLVKEGAGAIREQAQDKARDELIRGYILQNTDDALEIKLRKDIEDPERYNEIWQRIEQFKRDNPTKLWKRIHKETGTPCYAGFSLVNVRTFSVNDIGQKRLPFRDVKGSLHGRNLTEESQLRDNREIALSLLMWTYGKETRESARQNALRVYPLPKAKSRNW